MAAPALRSLAGKKAATPSPMITPTKLAKTKAVTVPKNTAWGDRELPLRAIAANWLLSPISAKNTVIKLKLNNCQSIAYIPTISQSNNTATVINIAAAAKSITLGLTRRASHHPKATPTKLVAIKAVAAPANTIQG